MNSLVAYVIFMLGGIMTFSFSQGTADMLPYFFAALCFGGVLAWIASLRLPPELVQWLGGFLPSNTKEKQSRTPEWLYATAREIEQMVALALAYDDDEAAKEWLQYADDLDLWYYVSDTAIWYLWQDYSYSLSQGIVFLPTTP
jgi:hypothetical protein